MVSAFTAGGLAAAEVAAPGPGLPNDFWQRWEIQRPALQEALSASQPKMLALVPLLDAAAEGAYFSSRSDWLNAKAIVASLRAGGPAEFIECIEALASRDPLFISCPHLPARKPIGSIFVERDESFAANRFHQSPWTTNGASVAGSEASMQLIPSPLATAMPTWSYADLLLATASHEQVLASLTHENNARLAALTRTQFAQPATASAAVMWRASGARLAPETMNALSYNNHTPSLFAQPHSMAALALHPQLAHFYARMASSFGS